jgi:hypothetical protein
MTAYATGPNEEEWNTSPESFEQWVAWRDEEKPLRIRGEHWRVVSVGRDEWGRTVSVLRKVDAE